MVTRNYASTLPTKATLVGIECAKWNPRKADKQVTAKANRMHNASEDAGIFRKLLINKDRLQRITELESAVRKLHYTYTKPWFDDGLRILPNALHAEFAKKFRELKREFDEAADKFCRHYEHYVQERRSALGQMFNPADYPSPNSIRDKFRLEIRTSQIPDAADFRSEGLDANTVDDIKREVSDTNTKMIAAAMHDSMSSVAELVSHMSAKLKSYNAGRTTNRPDVWDNTKLAGSKRDFFTDSLVENIRELADLLPAFNLTNDPKFDAIAKRVKAELCVEDADKLRESVQARESVQKSADDILKEVSSLLG